MAVEGSSLAEPLIYALYTQVLRAGGHPYFTREILFDEKIGGSFHMAVGSGYPETGSLNRSSVHWDMICDLRNGGEIRVDGELLYQNGKFVLNH